MSDSLMPLATLDAIQQREVAVIGFDDTATAHALNLRDSGVDVRIGLVGAGRARRRVEAEGFYALTPEEATGDSDLIAVVGEADPGEMAELVTRRIGPLLTPGSAVILGDGTAARYFEFAVPAGVDVAMVRAMSPGQVLRAEYVDGRGVPAMVAVHTDASGSAWHLAASYAAALGAGRAGLYPTTIEADAEAMAFSASVIQPRMGELLLAGHDTLVAAGYPAELAYLACVHEIKNLVDRLYVGGLGQRDHLGQTGRGPSPDTSGGDDSRADSERLRAALQHALGEVQRATSVPESAQPALALQDAAADLRRTMSWLRA